MQYLVALDIKTRFHRPAIGEFTYSPKHERHVWRSEETSDIARLADLTNEALTFVRRMDQVDLVVGIYTADDAPVLGEGIHPTPEPEESEFNLDELPRLKRRKLLV